MEVPLVFVVILLLLFLLPSALALLLNEVFFGISGKLWRMEDKHEGEEEKVPVRFESGRNVLSGYLYGEENTKGMVVMVHGMGVLSSWYLPEIRYFLSKGYRVFSYNATGYRPRTGRFHGFPQAVRDLDAVLSHVEKFGLPITIVGHSMGGYAATAVLGRTKVKVDSVLAYAPFNDIKEVIWHYTETNLKGIPRPVRNILARMVLTAQRFWFDDDLDLTGTGGINASDARVLVAQGGDDDEVYPDSTAIYAHRNEITNPNFSFIFFPLGTEATHKGVVRVDKDKANLFVLEKALEMMEGK